LNKQKIKEILQDYNWMIKEIKRQRDLLAGPGRENMAAQYGIESVMPKPQGNTSDPVVMEVVRRDKNSKWVEKLEQKVLFIQKNIHVITDEREKAVLECLLDGLSMTAISQHMGLSRRHVHTIRESIVNRISHNAHFAHFSQEMTK